MKRFLFLSVMILLAFAFIAEEAAAIPAFARKYRMSCSTCHQPFPRLKEFGDDFAGNGFVLENEEAPRYYVDTGDETLDLIRDFPIAIRLDTWAMYNTESGRDLDFQTPYVMKLLSGGELAKNFSYYVYFYLDEYGDVAGIDDAFVQFNDLFGQDLDLYIGQYSLSDPLMKSELRTTYEPYKIYKSRVAGSNIRLSYDRGFFVTYGGLPTGTGITFEMANGNGIGGADGDHNFDNDANNVFGLHLSQDVGGLFSLGGFGLMGKEKNVNENEVMYVGVDAGMDIGPIALSLQYMSRTDSNPLFIGTNQLEVVTNGIIAEAVYLPNGDKSKWFTTLLFNMVDCDSDDHTTWINNGYGPMDYQTATVHWGYLMRRNVRLGIEVRQDLENDETRAGIGIVTAF